MTLDSENPPDASSRKGKLYRLVGVSFGLLCILQVALNISLRLVHYAKLTDFIKNLTEEGKDLKSRLSTFDNYSQQGWIYFNHSFYHISVIKKSWQESRDDCQQRGADLVIISNKEEGEFARQFKRLTWIGLTDGETEGTWKWVDGTALNTSYWNTGEPNSSDGTDEDCAEIRHFVNENSWNATPCKKKNYWLCEKTMAL